jgi:hypothetical protein
MIKTLIAENTNLLIKKRQTTVKWQITMLFFIIATKGIKLGFVLHHVFQSLKVKMMKLAICEKSSVKTFELIPLKLEVKK